jgi:hypothetical protein
MAKKQTNFDDFFDDNEEGECPPLKPAIVHAAEKSLGYRLPAAYVDLLKVRNGAISSAVSSHNQMPAMSGRPCGIRLSPAFW